MKASRQGAGLMPTKIIRSKVASPHWVSSPASESGIKIANSAKIQSKLKEYGSKR
jgi:hypothetical protein